ncbi:hypothetical protein K6U21_15560 [Vibrio vulnificus]|uniref:hypothetical protein n=1 Tax=Vibrio vulnificus TaxID=672 RepID=UPI001EE9D20E|nr:hypothetical protein [Vibrio vulnificus]MCG6305576.1 hypothetical protein [Vibrio vulnificus]
MNFLFHTLSLTSSGGSRVITNLINYLAGKGHKIAIVTDRNRVTLSLQENANVHQGYIHYFQQHLKTDSGQKAKDKYPILQRVDDWNIYQLKIITLYKNT